MLNRIDGKVERNNNEMRKLNKNMDKYIKRK